jgi:hypothetical protein
MRTQLIAVGISTGLLWTATYAQSTSIGPAKKAPEIAVTLTTKPSPPVSGSNELTVTVTAPDKTPVTGADVSVTFLMPAMPAMKMGEMKNTVALKSVSDKPEDAGKYTGKGQIMMAGTWNVTVSVKVKDQEVASKKLTLTAK